MTDASGSIGGSGRGGKTRRTPSFFCLTYCFKPDKNEKSEEAQDEINSLKLSEQAKEKAFEERKKTQPIVTTSKPLLGAEAPMQQGEMGALAKRSGAPLGAPVGAVPTPVPATGSNSRVVFLGSISRDYLEQLLRASAEVLGKGALKLTCKVFLESGSVVAVKRLRNAMPEREFRQKVRKLGKMQSAYLVPMQGYYCYRDDDKLLVYEFVSLGSLSALLHGKKEPGSTPLGFEARASIALSAARGIEYIHSTGPTASHGNIKSSNVLLSGSNMARISDQGLTQLATPKALPSPGCGYRAPEFTDIFSQKADVYSFGILLMELLTGKAPSDKGVGLPGWVLSKSRDKWITEVFDHQMVQKQIAKQEMVQLLQLAIDCTARYPHQRPTMAKVAIQIDEILRSISGSS